MAGIQSVFSAGFMYGIPTGANPTPVLFGALQDVSVDFSFDLKQLYGQYQFALEQARGKAKCELKASIGRFDPALFNSLCFGTTSATGEKLSSLQESGVIPATPFQITVVNGSTFGVDLGVYSVTLGKFLTRVASGPATGQYSVNTTTGVYTFSTTDVGGNVKISYTYGAATGTTIAGSNLQMGAGPIFSVHLVNSFTGVGGKKSLWLNFPAVQSAKLQLPMKLDDFAMPSIDMQAQDDGTGNVFSWSMTGNG